jgi:hypothetical protein
MRKSIYQLFLLVIVGCQPANYFVYQNSQPVAYYESPASLDGGITLLESNQLLLVQKNVGHYWRAKYKNSYGWVVIDSLHYVRKSKKSSFGNPSSFNSEPFWVLYRRPANGSSGYTSANRRDSAERNKYPGSVVPSAGGPVQVKGYYRKNGTYVQPHTRSAPRRH